MNLIGAFMGLALGLVVVALLEYRDSSVRTEEDVLVALSLPVLALVPTMSSSRNPRFWRRRRTLRLGSSSAAMVLVAAAVEQVLRFSGWSG
jgi:hypothetical protein